MPKPNARRMRSCHEGKQRFPTLNAARTAASNWIQRREKQGNPIVTYMRAYGCPCGGFHIGRVKGAINWDRVMKSPVAGQAQEGE